MASLSQPAASQAGIFSRNGKRDRGRASLPLASRLAVGSRYPGAKEARHGPPSGRTRAQAENGAANSSAAGPGTSSSSRFDRVTATGTSDRLSPASQQPASTADAGSLRGGPASTASSPSFSNRAGPASLPGSKGSPQPPSSTLLSPPPPLPRPTLDEIMAFDGVPELVNGRLAMLGFVCGGVVEVRDKVSFLDQVFSPEQFGLFYFGLSALLVTAASVIPLLRSSSSSPPGFLFFTEDAEKANGRLAMLGLVGVLFLEYLASFLLKAV